MDPAGISITVGVASTVVRPLIAKLFVRENRGAGLVDKPVRVSPLVSWRDENRPFTERDVHKLTTELVPRTKWARCRSGSSSSSTSQPA